MKFVTFDEVASRIRGKTVAVVGSAPSVLNNAPGFVDDHDLVIRINNFKTGERQGFRCDLFYSFFGTSIKKTRKELERAGVSMMMCKLPNSKPIESAWHGKSNKPHGIDYRYIYIMRAAWWWCDTFIPDDARFLRKFELLEKHQPTTGFAAILDVLDCKPKSVYLTGFDGFSSGMHNVDEPWREKNMDDPIRHRSDLEMKWLKDNAGRYPMEFDAKLTAMLEKRMAA
jgi:hypothetical protein